MKFLKKLSVGTYRVLFGQPNRNAVQAIADAVHIHARRMAEAEYHRTMIHFYADRAAGINPHFLWWEFAEAKQKEDDHIHEWDVETKRASEAQAKVVACKARLEKLKT